MWNYGLILTDQPLTSQFEIIRKPWPQNDFPFYSGGCAVDD